MLRARSCQSWGEPSLTGPKRIWERWLGETRRYAQIMYSALKKGKIWENGQKAIFLEFRVFAPWAKGVPWDGQKRPFLGGKGGGAGGGVLGLRRHIYTLSRGKMRKIGDFGPPEGGLKSATFATPPPAGILINAYSGNFCHPVLWDAVAKCKVVYHSPKDAPPGGGFGGFWGVFGGSRGGVPQNGPFSGFSHFSGNSPENLWRVDEKIIVDINSWTNFLPAHKKNIFVMGKFSGQHSAEKIFLPGKLFRQICQNPARRNLTKCAHAKSDKSAKTFRRDILHNLQF